MEICYPKKENKNKRKDTHVLGACQRTEKAREHKGDNDTKSNCVALRDSLKGCNDP